MTSEWLDCYKRLRLYVNLQIWYLSRSTPRGVRVHGLSASWRFQSASRTQSNDPTPCSSRNRQSVVDLLVMRWAVPGTMAK